MLEVEDLIETGPEHVRLTRFPPLAWPHDHPPSMHAKRESCFGQLREEHPEKLARKSRSRTTIPVSPPKPLLTIIKIVQSLGGSSRTTRPRIAYREHAAPSSPRVRSEGTNHAGRPRGD